MDGCTHWFDGWWRHCCDAHDLDYINDTVSFMSHFNLFACVAESAPVWWLTWASIAIGFIMFIATLLWWIFKKALTRKKDRDIIKS